LVTKHTSYQVPTTTCSGTKVPLLESFSTAKVRRSYSYLFQALFAHSSVIKVRSLKLLKFKLHIHFVATAIMSQRQASTITHL